MIFHDLEFGVQKGEWDKQPLILQEILARVQGAERVNTAQRTVTFIFHSAYQSLHVASVLNSSQYPFSQPLYIHKLYKKPHAGPGLPFDVDTAHIGVRPADLWNRV